MHDRAGFGVWREGLLREAAEERLATEARRGRGTMGSGGKGVGVEVRWGTVADETAVAGLLELNGMPRWVAFEERFIVAEGYGGRLLAAMRYRIEPKRLVLGLPIVDPWAGERRMVGALYGGAVELARGIGVGEIVARPTGPGKRFRPSTCATPDAGGTSCPTPYEHLRCRNCRRAAGVGWPRYWASRPCHSPKLSEARAISGRVVRPCPVLPVMCCIE
jgi:hypothetical protein